MEEINGNTHAGVADVAGTQAGTHRNEEETSPRQRRVSLTAYYCIFTPFYMDTHASLAGIKQHKVNFTSLKAYAMLLSLFLAAACVRAGQRQAAGEAEECPGASDIAQHLRGCLLLGQCWSRCLRLTVPCCPASAMPDADFGNAEERSGAGTSVQGVYLPEAALGERLKPAIRLRALFLRTESTTPIGLSAYHPRAGHCCSSLSDAPCSLLSLTFLI